jgi:hypothetical protein
MELEALDKTGVRETLEAALGRGWRTPRVYPAMNLTTEDVAQKGNQAQHLEVGAVWLMRARRHGGPRPAHRLGAIKLDQISIALGGCPGKRGRRGERLGLDGLPQ